ncbi:MAG: fasciclin domain-containing protein [Bacteroidaceae bacterium]|nr:fasciclin domain-containing protein [Bacteroidaceae bacterium]
MKRILYILAIALSILACREEIDKSNRYVFTGETVADFMLNRSEKYSHMITLMKRAGIFSLMQTWGQYTLFLPDNESVEKFVAEQDSIYHATKDTYNPVWTGITSPLFEDLSDSMANVIARTHVTEAVTRMAEMGEGSLPERNFNYRLLGVNYIVKGEQYYIMLNNSAAIINGDNNVENGVVHLVDKVIAPSQKNVPELIGSYQFFKLFTEAMNLTGFCDSLKLDNDNSYNPDEHTSQNDFGSTYYAPETRFYKYTGFIETDEVFNANGIYTIDELTAFSEKWYGTEDKENPHSPKNALYKFIAYHFVPRELPHNKIVPYDINTENSNFDLFMPTLYDRYDYFETMQGTMIKVVKPFSSRASIHTYINYNKRNYPYNIQMIPHLNIRVIPLTEFVNIKKEYSQFDQMANNGILHPIDKILIYNEDEMFGNILNERIRIDFYSLIPELSCNNIRYKLGTVYNMPKNYSKTVNIKNGGIKLVTFNPGTYNVDNISLGGLFDVEFSLPQLPPRVYEVRLGFTNAHAVFNQHVQVYIDGTISGSPFDANCNMTGRVEDEYTSDNGVENDKHMRSLRWMKAPVIFNDAKGIPSRHNNSSIRRIIATHYFGIGRHKIRFRLLGELPKDVGFDYLEFVPLHIVSDPTKPEDRH